MAKILVAEDDVDLQSLLGKVLAAKGHSVVTAGDGETAVALTGSEKPNLVLMDLNLPGIDGFEATRQLKADAGTKAIPIIALSVETLAANRDAIYDAGCEAFVNKPIDMDNLIEKISEVLGG